MRESIERLINSGVSAYRVSKGTGIPNNTVVRIFSGEAKIDNITLKNAEILSNYWEESDMNQVKTLEIEGKEYYVFDAAYFENEEQAENKGYYWDDETGYWVKEITDDTTTIF